MGRVCTFTVPGRPRAWKRTARTAVNPRTGKIMRLNDPETEAEKKAIAQLARIAWKGEPVCGPVALSVEAVFRIPGPGSWPKALRDEALAGRVPCVADPDLDRIINLVQDALVGIVYWDDNQVVRYTDPLKRYGDPERVVVTISVYDQSEAQKTPGQRDLERAVATGQMIAGRARPKSRPSRSKTGSK
jgi:Holliday junction resolvase RusA-like endonuclease